LKYELGTVCFFNGEGLDWGEMLYVSWPEEGKV